MITSKLTGKAQTTIPVPVRTALRLREGDELVYTIKGDHVILTKADHNAINDPFASFDEWASEADRQAYADLWTLGCRQGAISLYRSSGSSTPASLGPRRRQSANQTRPAMAGDDYQRNTSGLVRRCPDFGSRRRRLASALDRPASEDRDHRRAGCRQAGKLCRPATGKQYAGICESG
ncbi:MAG: type II toxin-antitoxin system PrlF family antitoxin [Alphaproteobacteria bacterium]|nr:type II toxin-antitoxin system PrlF family antitoxin [Alphaproteobacteria bacterium]